ncbi:hypothetical protein L873DRAFT_441590 [Choiromyces venosus 120613-1]|uniref:Uncharacterized protein n=1 Tax=Choiromyces venosus 120613-1 TaxID=1336337 RepID=A0A3N4J990_9PEZI|nr:hypothetical protein L873DRAFT_441590 [Choiromyces venosus 120613-1]
MEWKYCIFYVLPEMITTASFQSLHPNVGKTQPLAKKRSSLYTRSPYAVKQPKERKWNLPAKPSLRNHTTVIFTKKHILSPPCINTFLLYIAETLRSSRVSRFSSYEQNSNASNQIQNPGPYKRYFTTRHTLNLYNNIGLTAHYTLLLALLTKKPIFSTLGALTNF